MIFGSHPEMGVSLHSSLFIKSFKTLVFVGGRREVNAWQALFIVSELHPPKSSTPWNCEFHGMELAVSLGETHCYLLIHESQLTWS